jgi:hypothetical protein
LMKVKESEIHELLKLNTKEVVVKV